MAKVVIGKKKAIENLKTAKPGAVATGAKVTKVKSGTGKAVPPAQGRHLGKTTQMSVQKFQNKTLEDNRKKRLSDEQLAQLWCREFPQSKAVLNGNIDAAMVASVRNQYNLGKHGNDAPSTPIPRFDDKGQPMPFHGEKAAARREAREQKGSIARVKQGVVKKGKK